MFTKGFSKVASTAVVMSPDRYYEMTHEKDPYVGALAGAALGALTGGLHSRTAKAALIGAGLGAGAGGAGGHVFGRVAKNYQVGRVHKMLHDMNLKSTPSRKLLQPSAAAPSEE